MKKLVSFMHLKTGEGSRVTYTYSEVDLNGNIIAQNKKENFVVVDDAVQEHINTIEAAITARMEAAE